MIVTPVFPLAFALHLDPRTFEQSLQTTHTFFGSGMPHAFMMPAVGLRRFVQQSWFELKSGE
jgi:hypothetical protein